MRACPTVLLLALLTSGTPVWAAQAPSVAPTPAGHGVVLRDGRVIAAKTKPIIAFGQASFVDATGTPVRLDARLVDVAATRARSGAARSSARTWTERNLSDARGRIQVIGTDDAPDSESKGETDQLSLLRQRVEEVEERISQLGPDHASTPRLMKVQLQLQSEIGRLLHTDVAAGR